MRQYDMLELGIGAIAQKAKGVVVAQVAYLGFHALFQVIRIAPPAQHLEVVVGFQEYGVAHGELTLYLVVGHSYVGHYSHVVTVDLHSEAYGIGRVVTFLECPYPDTADIGGGAHGESLAVSWLTLLVDCGEGARCNVYGYHQALGYYPRAAYVVVVLVGDEYGAEFLDIEAGRGHALQQTAVIYAGIHYYGVGVVANVIAVAVAARGKIANFYHGKC